MLAVATYRLGDLLFSTENDHSTGNDHSLQPKEYSLLLLKKQFEQVMAELERMDTMRVKDLTMSIRTANLLLERIKEENAEKHASKDRHEPFQSEFVEHVNHLVQTTNEFLTTIGVVAALLLSIGIPWILTPLQPSTIVNDIPSSLNRTDASSEESNQVYFLAVANLCMVIFMVVSVTLSMLALVTSFGIYGSLNVSISEPVDRLWFLRKNKVSTCETYLLFSVASLSLSVPFGLYVLYGSVATFTSCVIIGLAFIRYILFLLKFTSTTHARLLPKFKTQVEELRKKYMDSCTTAPQNTSHEQERLQNDVKNQVGFPVQVLANH
jgi:hypothetical protein